MASAPAFLPLFLRIPSLELNRSRPRQRSGTVAAEPATADTRLLPLILVLVTLLARVTQETQAEQPQRHRAGDNELGLLLGEVLHVVCDLFRCRRAQPRRRLLHLVDRQVGVVRELAHLALA